MAACAQNISSHAVQLMRTLNLQRNQAQFCDCVVIQRLNPAQVFPAHRCVLSASSPVLASILSSTGALVELQDPCLSDSVLAMLLDYIYTGSMQYTHSWEQYCSLLTAATYLQMDKLQETLKAWQHTEVDAAGETDDSTEADHQPNKHVRNAHSTGCNSFRKHQPLFHSCSENSSQGEDCLPAPDVDKCREIDTGTVKQQEETSREENMKQLSLELRSKIEKEQIYGKETDEAEICRSTLPCLSASTIKDNVPHSQWTSSSSSLSSLPCCGAVSVICHSSNAQTHELTELSTKLHYPSLFKVSVSSSSPSGCTENDFSHNVSDRTGSQELNQKSNGSIEDCEQSDDVSRSIADQYDLNSDLTENQSNSEPQDRLCRNITRGLKNKTHLRFEDLPTKYQRLDSSDSHDVLSNSAHSHDLRVAVPLPALYADTSSNPLWENLCPKGEVKDEHAYSKGFPTNVERHNGSCNLYRPQTDMCPNVQKAETSTNDYSHIGICSCVPSRPESSQGNIPGNPSVFERCTTLELEQIMSQMHVDNNISEHESNVVWQSYRGHLQYHCMPQENTRVSDRDSDHKLSNPDLSDQPSDEEEVSTYKDNEARRQHFTRKTAERVVLLDISTTPAELLVTYKHSPEGGENQIAYDHKSKENTAKVQWEEATLAAVAHGKKCTVSESFNGAETNSLSEEANVAETQSVGKHRSCPDEAVEVGNHASTFTVRSQPPESSTSPGITSFTPPVIMKTNKSAPLSTPAQHPFKCYLCDRSFSQRGSLNRHVRSHLGVRPFPCPNCPMTFSRQYRVTEHMRVHQRCSLGTDFVKPSASPT